MFTFRQLQIFETLSRNAKVIDVANELGLSQSAISMSIKELERLLDEPLFERIGKKLTLNERGHLFLQQISHPMQELENIYKNFATDKLQGELRIGSSVTIADYLMPKLLAGYRDVNEKVELRLKSANTKDVVRMVKDGVCDIGFVEGECHDEMLVMTKIMSDELVVVSKDKNLKDKAHFIDVLASYQWIMREVGSGTRAAFLDQIAPIDKEINIFMELEHTEGIKNFLKLDEHYLACLPRISVEDDLQEEKLFAIEIKGHSFSRNFVMITRKGKVLSALISHFESYVLQSYGV